MSKSPIKEPLFAEERQAQILRRLKKEHKLLVPDLCEQFGVSSATIRNDLNDMESRGLLKRTHGGAILTSKTGFEQDTRQKLVRNAPQKEAIARLAAEMVEDGDTIAIDTGTTALAFARAISSKHGLTVVTNDLSIAAHLEEESDAQIILAGGLIRRGYHCTVGPLTTACMESLGVDKCFLATNGFTAERGISTPDLGQAEVKRRLASIGTQVVVLCDSEKLGQNGLVTVLPTAAIHTLITDQGISPDLREQLEGADIEVKVAPLG